MKKYNSGFTLAEIMVVVTLIGLISAIVMPNVGKLVSAENKNIAKFKKGHNDLLQVIETLSKSDKYYIPGNLGVKPDGTRITGKNAGDTTYFCKTFADTLQTKNINCKTEATTKDMLQADSWKGIASDGTNYTTGIDTVCITQITDNKAQAEITTKDGIVYYQASTITFGEDDYSHGGLFYETIKQHNTDAPLDAVEGFDIAYRIYKVICMDIDGIPAGGSVGCDDKKDVCPFGYGVRIDGKMISGKRTYDWLKKEIGKSSDDE